MDEQRIEKWDRTTAAPEEDAAGGEEHRRTAPHGALRRLGRYRGAAVLTLGGLGAFAGGARVR